MTTITRTDYLAAAATLEAAADTSALTAAILWGLTNPTKEELAGLWVDASPETGKKRRQRAANAAKRWQEACQLAADTLAPVVAAYNDGGEADAVTQAAKVAAAMTGVVLDSALTLASWLEALAEQAATVASGKASESVAKLTGQKKAATRAPRQPKGPTAKAKGGSAAEPAAVEAGAIRTADISASAAAVAEAGDALLAEIKAAMAEAEAAPDVAAAVAIMAAAWGRSAGITLA